MKCSRMSLNDRRYKPPPRVSKCEGGPIVRQCTQRINLSECPLRHRSRSCRSTSSQTSHSENSSSSDSQKTPLIIVNLKIAPDVITMAKNNSRQQNNLNRKLPPFCTKYQKQSQSSPNNKSCNSVNNAIQDANMKVINDFIIQGTLIGNHRRQQAVTEGISPDIIIDCDECTTTMCDSTINVFNNINTDLLLSLDYYEMDSFGLGRLACDSTHPPTPEIPSSSTNRANSTSRTPTPTLLAVPSGYRPLSLRTPSPNTRAIIDIRVDLKNRDKKEINLTKDIEYNLNRLKEKRGIRNRSEKSF